MVNELTNLQSGREFVLTIYIRRKVGNFKVVLSLHILKLRPRHDPLVGEEDLGLGQTRSAH